MSSTLPNGGADERRLRCRTHERSDPQRPASQRFTDWYFFLLWVLSDDLSCGLRLRASMC